jgi:DNA mismatch repair protein MutL
VTGQKDAVPSGLLPFLASSISDFVVAVIREPESHQPPPVASRKPHMGKVHRLSAELANQIAAGEVVERPASVVKELVENAIDAHATRVVITVEFGGKKLIRVEDNGEGMVPDDALLALDRHATSKISRSEDLAAILTHGFRGEALPSIASVSHLVLRTRTADAVAGTEIRVNGGTTSSVREVGTPPGTSVEVGDLFYNLPARRKFLKADGAEMAQVSRMVTQLALAYPEVGFTLVNGSRKVLECPPVRSLRDRFYQLYGEREDLIEVGKDAAGIRVHGLIAALAEQGPKRGPQNIFVNRRIVKDKTIAHAIIEAYSVASVKERSPEVHLFIELEPDQVDVNVHPTKAEVRFRNQSAIHEVVRRALSGALGQGPAPELQLRGGVFPAPQPVTMSFPGLLGGIYPNRWAPVPGSQTSVPIGGWPSDRGARAGSGADESMPEAGGASAGLQAGAPRDGIVAAAESMAGVAPVEGPLATLGVRPMIPLGQFRDTFIIAIDDEGIAIIDQHVAHERVLFERVMQRLTDGRLESQRLLEPLIVELPASGCQVLVSRAAELERFGFEVGEFGGNSVRLVAVPALLTADECADAVRALAEDLDGLDSGASVDEALRRIAATTACHAAVKAHAPLTHEKMVHILEELRRTAYSTVCPHGRPVMLRLTRREIEKNFQRV